MHFQSYTYRHNENICWNNREWSHCPGQAGVNQLGGVFVNGRPLPDYVRWVRQLFICKLFGMFLIFVITVWFFEVGTVVLLKRFLDVLRLCDHQEKDCGTCPHGREAVWHIQVRVSIFQILMEKIKYPSTGLHGYTIDMFAIPLLIWDTSTMLHGHKGCKVTCHHDLTVAVLAIRHNAQSTTILSFLVSWFNVCRPFCLSVLVCFCIPEVLPFFVFLSFW